MNGLLDFSSSGGRCFGTRSTVRGLAEHVKASNEDSQGRLDTIECSPGVISFKATLGYDNITNCSLPDFRIAARLIVLTVSCERLHRKIQINSLGSLNVVDLSKAFSVSLLLSLASDRSQLGLLVSSNSTTLMEGKSSTSLGLVGVEISNDPQYDTEFFHLTTSVVDLVEFDHLLYTALDLERISQQIEDKGQIHISEVHEVLSVDRLNQHERPKAFTYILLSV